MKIEKSPYRCCDNHTDHYDVRCICDYFWWDYDPYDMDEMVDFKKRDTMMYACTRFGDREWITLKPCNIKHTERFGCAGHSKFIGVVRE